MTRGTSSTAPPPPHGKAASVWTTPGRFKERICFKNETGKIKRVFFFAHMITNTGITACVWRQRAQVCDLKLLSVCGRAGYGKTGDGLLRIRTQLKNNAVYGDLEV
jgi:hypothetical protein